MYYNYVFLLKKIFFYYSSLWFSKNNIILVLKYLWKIGFELNLDYIWWLIGEIGLFFILGDIEFILGYG